MEVPQKIKNGATIWCRKSISEYILKGNESKDSKEVKTRSQRDICMSMFIYSSIAHKS